MAEKPTYEELEQKNKELETQLVEGEQFAARFRCIFRAIPDATVFADTKRRIVAVNPALTNIFGYEKEELLGKRTQIVYSSKQDYEELGRTRFNLQAEEKLKPYEMTYRKKGGEVFTCEVVAATVKDDDGNAIGFLGILRDITERKRAEAALQEREERYRTLASNIPGAVYWCDENWRIHFMSDGIHEISGYPASDFVADKVRSFASVMHPEDIKVVEEKVSDCLSKEIPVEVEYRMICADGSIRWIHDKAQGILNEDGKLKWFDGVLFDITERKQAEKALKTQARILDNMVEGVNVSDENGIIFFANPAFDAMFGYEPGELIDKPVSILNACTPEENVRRVAEVIEQLKTHGVWSGELNNIRKDGTQFITYARVSALEVSGKQYWISVQEDITDHKRAEEEKKEFEARLQQAQRLEAIGTLAGGIAHNFNNLLMAIQGNVSLMLYDIDPAHPFYEFLTSIKSEVENGAKLTAQFLGYARKGKYFPQPLNLNQLVKKASSTIGATKKEISIHRELADDLFAIEADQAQIQQVLLNLLINAADAMPGGGDLILKTANVIDKDMKDKVYDPKPGNYVQLTVTDTGSGMDKETQERIFEPFFTTKEMASGTGLGLASVYGIIKGHGGYVDVESEPGRGTTFTVYLPATEKTVEETLQPSEPIVKGTETILLVDDEDRVMDVGTKLLEKLGYTVLEARGGKEAVEIYKENKDRIDLVLLDMVMPRMGGGEAYDKMKEINPDVKVLLSSGYDIDSEAKEILARGCNAFIQKPFGMQELSQNIREVLGKK